MLELATPAPGKINRKSTIRNDAVWIWSGGSYSAFGFCRRLKMSMGLHHGLQEGRRGRLQEDLYEGIQERLQADVRDGLQGFPHAYLLWGIMDLLVDSRIYRE